MTLEEQYKEAQESAKKQRAEGFAGRIVLDGEMNFEEFKLRRQMGTLSLQGVAGNNSGNFKGMTTAAIGEEGESRPPQSFTQAYGEDDPNRRPILTTQAIGEDDPNYKHSNFILNATRTTMAVGEEDESGMGGGAIRSPGPIYSDSTNVNPPQQTTNTLTDPSQFAQAQVGAAVQQPTLPQGGAVLPNLALQSVTDNQLQTTPGLTGTVQAATPTATTAPTIESTAIPTASQVTQTTAPAQGTYDYTAATTAGNIPQATAAQGTVTQPMVAAQEDLTSLPPEATVQGQLANISQSITSAVNAGTALPAFAQGAKRIVDAAMQQRGLGASSIAAEALAQGIISSSIPIAQQDAATYKEAIFANLNNRQQAALNKC
jgi:hypothetical protein